MLARLIADRLVLQPTTHPVFSFGKSRRFVQFGQRELEIWTQRVGAVESEDVDVFVLKFSGTAGRAERASSHPLDHWTGLRAELWSVNPPGYGGSSGRASVRYLAEAGKAAYDAISEIAEGRPIIVTGNSLGSATALHVGASRDVAGLILRNPPPLRQMIVGLHGWWNLWLGAAIIAREVPHSLCSIHNARRCQAPAVFVMSEKDRTVPPYYQLKVLRAYGGKKRVLVLDGADHGTTAMCPDAQRRYDRLLDWLRDRALGVQGPVFAN